MHILRGRGHHKGEPEKAFVDLGEVEVPNDRTEVRIKIAEPESVRDAKKICDQIGTGSIVIVDVSRFDGTFEERGAFLEALHSYSRSNNYVMNYNGTIYILSPSDVSVKRI